MQDERCQVCGNDVALGTPLFARRVKLLTDADPGVAFVCIDCRANQPLLDENGNTLDEDQLAGMKYVVGRGGPGTVN